MSDKNNKKVFKFWSVLGTDKIEKWLEDQAAEGWILQNKGVSTNVFHFKKGQPERIKFVIDYRFLKSRGACEPVEIEANWKLYKKCRAWNIRGTKYKETEPDNIEIKKDTLRNYKTRCFLILIAAFSMITGSIFSLGENPDIYKLSVEHYILTASIITIILSLILIRRLTKATTELIERNNSNYRKIFKFWLAWNSDTIEKWLENQAAKGWILKDINFNMTTFWFEKSEPAKISFATDFQNRPAGEYFNIAEDSGWKHYSTNCGWHLWSKEYQENEAPVFFSDPSSLIKKFMRLFTFLGFIAAYEYIILYTTISRFISTESIATKSICALQFVATILITWVGIKLLIKIKSLKQSSGY